MTVRLKLEIEGRIEEIMLDESRALAKAAGRAIRESTADLQGGYRRAVETGTGSRRLANAVRSRLYEPGTAGAAGIVYSRARKRGEGGKSVDIIEVLSRGATIRPTRKSWLLIVNPGFGRTRSGRTSRRGLARAREKIQAAAAGRASDVYFQPVQGGKRVAIIEKKPRSKRSTILGWLVRQVRIPKQFDLETVERQVRRELPRRFLDAWEAEMPA